MILWSGSELAPKDTGNHCAALVNDFDLLTPLGGSFLFPLFGIYSDLDNIYTVCTCMMRREVLRTGAASRSRRLAPSCTRIFGI